jgi:hypothetical protein
MRPKVRITNHCLPLISAAFAGLVQVTSAATYPWQTEGTTIGGTESYDSMLASGTILLQGGVQAAPSVTSTPTTLGSTSQSTTLDAVSSVSYTPTRKQTAASYAFAPTGSEALLNPATSGSSLTSTSSISPSTVESVVFNGFSGENVSGSAGALSFGNESSEGQSFASFTVVPEPGTIVGALILVAGIAVRELLSRRAKRNSVAA